MKITLIDQWILRYFQTTPVFQVQLFQHKTMPSPSINANLRLRAAALGALPWRESLPGTVYQAQADKNGIWVCLKGVDRENESKPAKFWSFPLNLQTNASICQLF